MKVGFVSIVGRPNVGKSTLLNALLDYNVAITSDKPQTTRDQIRGIFNSDTLQVVFIDTPGIHKPKRIFGEGLNESSYGALTDSDWTLFLTPSDQDLGPGDQRIIDRLRLNKSIAVITKIDLTNPEDLEKKAKQLKGMGFKHVIATSSKIAESRRILLELLEEILPEGEQLYPEDYITDKSMSFITKEIIRESAIEKTSQEVPHSLAVVIDSFHESEEEYKIEATLYVERESQKGMLVGKGGSMVKRIGVDARQRIEALFDIHVKLNLSIKVAKNWTTDTKWITKLGY